MSGTDSKVSDSRSREFLDFHIYREEPLFMSRPTLSTTQGLKTMNMVSLLASCLRRMIPIRQWTMLTPTSISRRMTQLLLNLTGSPG